MEIEPRLFTAKVMHKRLFPRVHAFTYPIYYLALPLPAVKLPGVMQQFYQKDVGARDGSDPIHWAKDILARQSLDTVIEHIILITMPRVFGYVFNPVSFYLCLDKEQNLRAVIAEVHNTFGEQHNYLCAREDKGLIQPDDWMEAEKLFHVSPFLERNGHYRFRFDFSAEKLGIWIDYYAENGEKQLVTSLIGKFQPLTRKSLTQAFWRHPLIPLKAIALIHWHALKLVRKRIRYITKPLQHNDKVTYSRHLTEK